MKTILITSLFVLIFFPSAYSQIKVMKPDYDTTLAKQYFDWASDFQKKGNYDSAIFYFDRASAIYLTLHNNASITGNLNLNYIGATEKYADCINKIGRIFCDYGQQDTSLTILKKNINFCIRYLSESNIHTANAYYNAGIAYYLKGEVEKSLEVKMKALSLRMKLLGEKNLLVAGAFNSIGLSFIDMGEYDKALDYLKKL